MTKSIQRNALCSVRGIRKNIKTIVLIALVFLVNSSCNDCVQKEIDSANQVIDSARAILEADKPDSNSFRYLPFKKYEKNEKQRGLADTNEIKRVFDSIAK